MIDTRKQAEEYKALSRRVVSRKNVQRRMRTQIRQYLEAHPDQETLISVVWDEDLTRKEQEDIRRSAFRRLNLGMRGRGMKFECAGLRTDKWLRMVSNATDLYTKGELQTIFGTRAVVTLEDDPSQLPGFIDALHEEYAKHTPGHDEGMQLAQDFLAKADELRSSINAGLLKTALIEELLGHADDLRRSMDAGGHEYEANMALMQEFMARTDELDLRMFASRLTDG